jgi:hypothetical protein
MAKGEKMVEAQADPAILAPDTIQYIFNCLY